MSEDCEDCGGCAGTRASRGEPWVNPVCGVHVSVGRAVQPHGRADHGVEKDRGQGRETPTSRVWRREPGWSSLDTTTGAVSKDMSWRTSAGWERPGV